MVGKWYRIKGFTNEMIEAWSTTLRDDIVVKNEDGKIDVKIKLTWVEMISMKIKMVLCNMKTPYVFQLEKIK